MRNDEEKAKHAKYMREYRERFRDKVNAGKAEWRKTNREIYNEQVRANRLKNLDRERQRDRDRYASSPERREQQKSYMRTPKAKRHLARWSLLHKYRLSSEQFDAMLIAQSGRCGICNNPFEGPKDPAVDHCHAAGIVRALLCSLCNRGLGHFKDSTDLLERAAAYLRGVEELK